MKNKQPTSDTRNSIETIEYYIERAIELGEYPVISPKETSLYKAIEHVIELAKKDIPMLVENKLLPIGRYDTCQRCGVAFITELGVSNYCGSCGQKLDWSGKK